MTNASHRYAMFAAILLAIAGQVGVVAAAANGPDAPTDQATRAIDSIEVPRTSYASSYGYVGLSGDSLERALVETIRVIDVPGVIALAGTTSRASPELIDNDVRAAIYDVIRERPTIRQTDLAEEIDVPTSTVRYHVRILENAGVVRVEVIWGKRWLSLPTTDRADVILTAALDDETLESVFVALAKREPASVSELAAELDRAPSTVCHHLQRLAKADLVKRERDGSAVRTSLTDGIRERLQE